MLNRKLFNEINIHLQFNAQIESYKFMIFTNRTRWFYYNAITINVEFRPFIFAKGKDGNNSITSKGKL